MSIVREPEPGGAGLVPCHIQVGEEEMAISRDLPGETQSAARHIPRHAMRRTEPSALAKFVRERLAELGMKQSEFCRLTGFDQGLLSKIQNSMITSLSIESALRLSIGLGVSPKKMFQLIDRMDLDEIASGGRHPARGEFRPSGRISGVSHRGGRGDVVEGDIRDRTGNRSRA